MLNYKIITERMERCRQDSEDGNIILTRSYATDYSLETET